jgi:hypothetical protein
MWINLLKYRSCLACPLDKLVEKKVWSGDEVGVYFFT